MGEAKVISFPTDDALALAAAAAWIDLVTRAQVESRPLRVALSGGRVTKKWFVSVVAMAREKALSLNPVDFFWADERGVPPDNSESNFRLANECLFQPAGVLPGSVHRIEGELDPANAAARAEAELRRVTGQASPSMPVLDLVLLGMGEDGHVASLFPGDAGSLADMTSVFRAVLNSPKPPAERVTLGHGPIASAREVWVLASGNGKAAALQESLHKTGQTPLAGVVRNRALTVIYSDIQMLSSSR